MICVFLSLCNGCLTPVEKRTDASGLHHDRKIELTRKMNGILIPSIDFQDTSIKNAVIFLSEQSRIHDQGLKPNPGEGIEFIVMLDDHTLSQTINFRAKYLSISEILRVIIHFTDCIYRIKDDKVYLCR